MKFINTLTLSLKDAIGVDKKLGWNSEEMFWFHNMTPKLTQLAHAIEARFEPFVKKAGEPMMTRTEFRNLCVAMLTEDFGLTREELR